MARDELAQRIPGLHAGPWRAQALPLESKVPGLGGGLEQLPLRLPEDLFQSGVLQIGPGDACVDPLDIVAMHALAPVHGLGGQVGLQGAGQEREIG